MHSFLNSPACCNYQKNVLEIIERWFFKKLFASFYWPLRVLHVLIVTQFFHEQDWPSTPSHKCLQFFLQLHSLKGKLYIYRSIFPRTNRFEHISLCILASAIKRTLWPVNLLRVATLIFFKRKALVIRNHVGDKRHRGKWVYRVPQT